jgi:hypothetical protein
MGVRPQRGPAGRERSRLAAGSAVTCEDGWWACQDLNLGPHPYQGSAPGLFSEGDFVIEPRDLTDLVPADVRTELAAVVAALELHGPAVTNALRRLDRTTTAAWNVNPADPTEDEWRLVERGRYRPWLECGLSAGLHPRPARAGPLTNLTPDGSHMLFPVLRARLRRAKAQPPRPLLPTSRLGCLVVCT